MVIAAHLRVPARLGNTGELLPLSAAYRNGNGGRSAHPAGACYRDAESLSYPDTHIDADAIPYPHANRDGHPDAHTHTESHRVTYAQPNAYG